MSVSTVLKASGLLIIILIVLYVLSLFSLWTQLARYQSYWDRQNKLPSANEEILYVALGDSTAQAIGASHPSNGYVGIISKELATKHNQSVKTVNLSKSGAKIQDVLDTQIPALNSLKVNENTIITIEIGANDMISFNSEQFDAQMDELMGALPKQTIMSDIPYFGGSRFKGKEPDVETANKIMYRLADKHDIRLVPLHEKVKQNSGVTTLATDLFHPSNKGYRENWAPVFMEQL